MNLPQHGGRKTLSSFGSFRKKRQSEKRQRPVVKKTRRLTNSGFLDRAFENAWFLPEDEVDDYEQSDVSIKTYMDEKGY